MATNAFLALSSAVQRDIDARLGGLLDAKVDAAKVNGPDAVELVRSVRDLALRGGKRVRPALLVTGYRAANPKAALEPALDAGVAIELLHAYFLIHDDWMDGDVVRRGGPTVHVQLGKLLKTKRSGEHGAILAGDLAAAIATEALSRVEVAPARLTRAFTAFAQMQSDAIAGQLLDVLGRARDIEKVYELKTSSYTVRGPLRVGALLAGAKPDLLSTLDRFAMPVGVAFQLRDDLLSIFGDPSKTGKTFANDLKAGKKTLLLATGLRKARGKEHRLLSSVVGNPRASVPALKRAVEVLEKCGARRAVEERIDELVYTGLTALHAGRLPKEATSLLEGATRALTARVS